MTPRARRILAAVAAALALVILLAPVAILTTIDRGAADGMVMRALSAKMKRPVRFGRLSARLLSSDPTLTLDDVVVGSPPEITPDDLVHARRVVAHVRLGDLLVGRFAPTALAVEGIELRLVRLGPDRNNYGFGKGGTGGLLESVRSLSLTDGRMWMVDRQRETTLAGPFSHDGRPGVRLPFTLDSRGAIRGGAVHLVIRGGALNARRPGAPWPLDSTIVDGDTRLRIVGTSQNPFDFRGFDFAAKGAGPNLADIGYLVGADTPNTEPFDLTARVRRAGHTVRLTQIAGRIGASDITGAVSSDHSGPRRLMTATLRAGTLHAADVAAVLASAPPHAIARVTPGRAPPVAVKGLATPVPLPLKGLRTLDGELDLKAAHVLGYAAPLADLDLQAKLKAGKLVVSPLAFGLSPGRVTGRMSVNAAPDKPDWTVAGRLAGARIARLTPAAGGTADGDLDVWADLHARGASIREATGAAAGRIAFRVGNGRLQRGPAAILGGDVFQAIGLALGDKSATIPLTCAVGEFDAKGGVLSAQRLVIVTDAGVTQGTGGLDLGAGTADLTLKGAPTKRRLLHIDAPVTISGPLTHPKVGVDKGRALGQAGVAGALAVVATPLAAVLPFVGSRQSGAPDCAALLSQAARYVDGPTRP